jgi:hypothetical protein
LKFPERVRASLAAAIIALAAAGPAAAVTLTYDFDTLLTGNGPSNVTLAKLFADTTDYKTFSFDLKVDSNLNSVFGSDGTFESSLHVNTASNADPSSGGIPRESWGVTTVALNTNTSNTGGIAWDFVDSFCGSGSACNPKNPSSRLALGAKVKRTTTFSSVQNPAFGAPPFLLKVQGFGASSGYVSSSPIPEPQTYAMILAGLGLMGFIVRRRSQPL